MRALVTYETGLSFRSFDLNMVFENGQDFYPPLSEIVGHGDVPDEVTAQSVYLDTA